MLELSAYEKRNIGFFVPPSLKLTMDSFPLSKSAIITHAVKAALDDDNLVIKALRRRAALPPIGESNSVRLGYSSDPRLEEQLEVLNQRLRLGKEEIRRLAVEAYVHNL